MQIGSVLIDPPVILAPMAGVSNLAYRAIAREQGARLCITEMVNANALMHKSAKSFRLMELDPGETPVGIQIAGSDPTLMAEAAWQAQQQGADLIDINMGCPVPKVIKNGDGSALLNDRDKAISVVKEVVSRVSVPVTVKMRAGWDHTSITAPALAEAFERVGVKAIFVHARTRDDLYARPANWEFIRQVKEHVGIPVVGNGDIKTPQDAVKMMEMTGADGVMIGRSSFGDPWIFKRMSEFMETGRHLAPPGASERAEMARFHLRRLVSVKGEAVGIRQMRQQLTWYLHGTPESNVFRNRCYSLNTLEEAENLILEWMDHAQNEELSWI